MIDSINKYIALGIIGALIILYGYGQDYPQTYYIFGSFALLITAIHYRLLYFIALEIILVAGHSAILLGVGRYTQMALPVFLCLQLLIFYLMIGKENSIFLLTGIIGIALHSIGFTYENQWIFFSGSSLIAIYAYHNAYEGSYPSYIWAILNTIFAVLALYKIFF
ncbi:hypothetical protein [Legionella fallonii]|uniref:hypothetical protein n=1 Tax=Legionella fallonii TaxID=96230 RepID=UPI0038B35A63